MMKAVKYTFVAVAAAIFMLSSLSATGAKLVQSYRQPYFEAIEGSSVVFVPMSMDQGLTQSWAALMENQAERLNYSFEIRSANWKAAVGTRALSRLITEKPDIIVVQNFDVSSYARLLRRAVKAGIYVIQVNMASNFKTAAFVGADWYGIGTIEAKQMVNVCGKSTGASGKVALITGPVTAAASIYQLNGIKDVVENTDEIEIVAEQPGNWSAAKARSLAQTMIQTHPNLCGIIGFWVPMDTGTAAAIKQAGKQDDIYVISSGGGNPQACNGVRNGAYDMVVSYQSDREARAINDVIRILLQTRPEPGSTHFALYVPNAIITKQTLTPISCWNLKELKEFPTLEDLH